MSIWGAFSASAAAAKISNAISRIWCDLINFIIFKEVDLKLRGSVFILEQAHALSIFTYLLHHSGTSVDKSDQIGYVVEQNIEKILVEVWERQMPKCDFVEVIEEVKENISPKYLRWQRELIACKDYEGMVGAGVWTEIAMSKFMDNISTWYETEFDGDENYHSLSAQDMLDIQKFTASHIKKLI